MGSLMAGWSSRVLDQETSLRLRSRSLTKEKIEMFLKSTKEDKDGFETDTVSPKTILPCDAGDQEAKKGAWSLLQQRTLGTLEGQEEVGKPTKKLGTDWWMRSKWAYLNEPNQVHE